MAGTRLITARFPVGGVFTVAANSTNRSGVRPPAGSRWLVEGIAVDLSGAGPVAILQSMETQPGVFADVEIARGTGNFFVSGPIVISNRIFLSVANMSNNVVKIAFNGLELP